MIRQLMIAVVALAAVNACTSAAAHRADVRNATDANLTVGTVQREVRVGLSGAELAAVLGAPNIITTDSDRNEVWIYDKVATETVHSESSAGIAALILGGGGSVGGGGGGSAAHSAGASSRTQRMLTVIVRLGPDGRVRDFAYHASQF